MPLSVTVVGSTDRQIEELLRACGVHAVSVPMIELANLAHPTVRQPDIILIDLREETQPPAALSMVKRQHPTTGVIIAASRLDPTLMLEALRAGVNECVIDPLTPADLQAAIERVTRQRDTPTVGQVLAFVGAKGGVGTTTIAVNVATELVTATRASTLLIDLHLAYGDAALFVGAEPRFSIVDALENTHRLDESFLGSLVVQTKAGLDLLASSNRAMTGAAEMPRVQRLVEFAARHYGLVVLDVPRSDTALLDALQGAVIVIVTNQELAALRSASRMAGVLRQRHGKENVKVVLSRYDSAAEIGDEDLKRVIGGPASAVFPSDYRLAQHALNKGRPLVLDNHSKLATSLNRFAREVAGVTASRPEPKQSARLFGRFTGRR